MFSMYRERNPREFISKLSDLSHDDFLMRRGGFFSDFVQLGSVASQQNPTKIPCFFIAGGGALVSPKIGGNS
jgi:hypothetical protein